jgi:hypothetical protein
MSWKFWEKTSEAGQPKTAKLGGPKDLPHPVGKYLVVDLGHDPDWVWNLRSVQRPKEGSTTSFHVRVFSENDAALRKVSVKNYDTLNEHPELILFEGWFDKKSMTAQVQKKEGPEMKPRAA